MRCEYLLVGTGAGGGVAGALLAEAGKDVLFLEEGFYIGEESMTPRIGEMTARLYRNGGISPILGSPAIPFAEACVVGGGTVVNGAMIWRAPEWILQEWRERCGMKSLAPEEMAPYFETVEKNLGVRESVLETDANLDSLKLWQASRRLGWKTAMAPRAVEHCKNINRCPTGCAPCGKQSVLKNYLPRAFKRGARLLAGCRVLRIRHSAGRAHSAEALLTEGGSVRRMEIRFDYLVMAAGAVQSPYLLRSSGVSSRAGKRLDFHVNLRTAALFPEPLNAERGTMFTVQVQEFERAGIQIMASNLAPAYLALTLAPHGAGEMRNAFAQYNRFAIFTTMMRPKGWARVESFLGESPLLWHRLDPQDAETARFALFQTAKILFESGAEALYLPIKGLGAIRSMQELDSKAARLDLKNLEMSSMHAMASNPLGGGKDSVVRPDGRLWEARNVLVADASVLPGSPGESPQGTIMALAHQVIEAHLSQRQPSSQEAALC